MRELGLPNQAPELSLQTPLLYLPLVASSSCRISLDKPQPFSTHSPSAILTILANPHVDWLQGRHCAKYLSTRSLPFWIQKLQGVEEVDTKQINPMS
jgi:hypothetical protein